MKYKFQVEKHAFDIDITNSATFFSPTNIRVNDTNFTLMVGESAGQEIKSFFLDDTLFQVELERDGEGYPIGIYVNGEYYSASLSRIDKLFYYKEKPVKSSKSGMVKSFIPGYIKKIFFRVNDRVNEDDIVLIHEAMKMENEIRAPKTGIIKTIGVKEGENILANHLLFEIE